MVRRGRRRFEEEALHRADAAVGPEGQQHRSHRRAVLAEPAAVLPQRPPASVISTDLPHGLHHVVVLGVPLLGLVAAEVPRGPAPGGRAVLGRHPERTPAETAVRGVVASSERAEVHACDRDRENTPTAPVTACTENTGLSGSRATRTENARPSSATPIAASRLRDRYHNGKMRAFHSRSSGMATKAIAARRASPARNGPARRRKTIDITSPTAARATIQLNELGSRKSRAVNSLPSKGSRSHPMSLK